MVIVVISTRRMFVRVMMNVLLPTGIGPVTRSRVGSARRMLESDFDLVRSGCRGDRARRHRRTEILENGEIQW